jgi:2-succinyl-6-hydroxy-2,4-cyclohexadiene-1-carboxylate synthase
MKIWALHGFIGLASDFNELQGLCNQHEPSLDWQSVEYMHSRELSPQTSLDKWGEAFCKMVRRTGDSKPILLGYSQGGRLALQAFKADPHFWSGVILLSANPGIPPSERPARKKSDEEWAEMFLNQNFQKTLEKWNAQAVFQGSKQEPVRQESDFNRHQLADALNIWSVAQQEDFRPFLKSISTPMLFLSGENDMKYGQIGQSLAAQNPKVTHHIIPGAGHRIFMDQPSAVSFEITKFLQSLQRN